MVIWECPIHPDCGIVSEPGERESFSIELITSSIMFEVVRKPDRDYLVIGRKPHDRFVYAILGRMQTPWKIEPTVLYYTERVA